jgi:hypothetical protein
MTIRHICCLILAGALLQGCAGQRESYKKLMDKDQRIIRLAIGDREEALAIGNGFPGWWGYYPQIVSRDPSIASIECVSGRSAIPFRKPGVILGGERCYITAHKAGETWLLRGNKFANFESAEEQPGTSDRWVRVVINADQPTSRT